MVGSEALDWLFLPEADVWILRTWAGPRLRVLPIEETTRDISIAQRWRDGFDETQNGFD